MPQYEKSHNAFDNGLNERTEAIALVCCSRTLVGLAGLREGAYRATALRKGAYPSWL
jgi:hypothetical protein